LQPFAVCRGALLSARTAGTTASQRGIPGTKKPAELKLIADALFGSGCK
jgi:hypothetical protein